MKKTIKLLLIIISLTLIVNVNANKNDAFTMESHSQGTESTKLFWAGGSGVKSESFQVKKDATEKEYKAYCINSHANILGPTEGLVEEVSINPSTGGNALGYVGIYEEYNKNKKKYDESMLISALRVYTILGTSYATNMENIKGDAFQDKLTRQQIYYNYQKLSYDVKQKLGNGYNYVGNPTNKTGYEMTFSSNEVKNNFVNLVKAGFEYTKNTKANKGGVPSITSSPNVQAIEYTITNVNKITDIKVEGAIEVKVCPKGFTTDCNNATEAEGTKIYVRAIMDGDAGKKICEGKGLLTFKYEGNGGFEGGILLRKDSTKRAGYQKFIYLEDSTGEQDGSYSPDKSKYNCNPPQNIPSVECDKTKQQCDPVNCSLDFDGDSLVCGDKKNPTIEYDEEAKGVYNCVLEKKDGAEQEYKVKDVNKYCSIYCTETYKFDMPNKISTKAGRYFDLNLTVETARKDCYFSTGQITFNIDIHNLENELDIAKTNYSQAYTKYASCIYSTDSEGNPDVDTCRIIQKNDMQNYYNEIVSISEKIKATIKEFAKCNGYIDEFNYEFKPAFQYNYDESFDESALPNNILEKVTEGTIPYEDSPNYYCLKAEELDDAENCFSPGANTKDYSYKTCVATNSSINYGPLNTEFNCGINSEQIPLYNYGKRTKSVSGTLEYRAKRVYYNNSITGDISVFAAAPTDIKYSRIAGLPISYTTTPGTYNYNIKIDNLGENGRVSKVISNKAETDKYVCTYNVTDGAACVKDNDENYYICTTNVYKELRKDKNKINDIKNSSECVESSPEEAACVSLDYNCNNVAKKCTTIITNLPGNLGKGNERKNYEVSFKTISNSKVNPNKRLMGFNWNISSNNSLIAIKAWDTINFISYRADAVAQQTQSGTANLKEFSEKDTTFKVHMDANLINELKKYNEGKSYDNHTLNCYDYINNSITDKKTCGSRAGYTWRDDNKCVLENVFCYSQVINDLIKDGYIENKEPNHLGNRPAEDKQGDLRSSDFINSNIEGEINELPYYKDQSKSPEITNDEIGYKIQTPSQTIKDYWSIYNFTTLDIDNDGLADAGPSWR